MTKVISINRTPGDFVRDTRHLSVEDRGAYQDILDHIVILGQDADPPSLPDDDRAIANILGWSVGKWRRTKARLCEGPLAVLLIADGRLCQVRIAIEIEEARARIVSSSKAGKESGKARRQKADMRERLLNGRSTDASTGVEREPQRIANGTRTDCEPVTSHEPLVTNHDSSNTGSFEREIPSLARSSGGGGTAAGDRRWQPVWSQRAFQYRVDKIRDFTKRAKSLDKIGPGDGDFDAAFYREFGMTWDYWTAQSERHQEHFEMVAKASV